MTRTGQENAAVNGGAAQFTGSWTPWSLCPGLALLTQAQQSSQMQDRNHTHDGIPPRSAPAMGPGGRPQPWQHTDSTGNRRASPPSHKEQNYKAGQLDFGAPVKMPQKVFMCSLCCALIPKT